jgi:hypothetical protein
MASDLRERLAKVIRPYTDSEARADARNAADAALAVFAAWLRELGDGARENARGQAGHDLQQVKFWAGCAMAYDMAADGIERREASDGE